MLRNHGTQRLYKDDDLIQKGPIMVACKVNPVKHTSYLLTFIRPLGPKPRLHMAHFKRARPDTEPGSVSGPKKCMFTLSGRGGVPRQFDHQHCRRLFSTVTCIRHNANYVVYVQMPGCPQWAERGYKSVYVANYTGPSTGVARGGPRPN